MQIVSTPQGKVKLLPPTAELILDLRERLPLGLISASDLGGSYGIVMKCGESQLRAMKQQPPDTDEQTAMQVYVCSAILIAHAMKRYLEHGFEGLLIPCGYLRTKDAGKIESGIAYFGFPAKDGPHAAKDSAEPPDDTYDPRFGKGFTEMLLSFIRSVKESERHVSLTQMPTIGLDVRRRSELGRLGLGFAVFGSRIICLKTQISERDPAWTALRLSGVEQVIHLPSVTAAITEDQFAEAKFKAN